MLNFTNSRQLNSLHPTWNNNIQISPKQMEIIKVQDNIITLRSYGKDAVEDNFTNYGLVVICEKNEIEHIQLQMLDRGVTLEYYK